MLGIIKNEIRQGKGLDEEMIARFVKEIDPNYKYRFEIQKQDKKWIFGKELGKDYVSVSEVYLGFRLRFFLWH
jgi:hypothetical protein